MKTLVIEMVSQTVKLKFLLDDKDTLLDEKLSQPDEKLLLTVFVKKWQNA